jgi:hypothetical protein
MCEGFVEGGEDLFVTRTGQQDNINSSRDEGVLSHPFIHPSNQSEAYRRASVYKRIHVAPRSHSIALSQRVVVVGPRSGHGGVS